MDTISLSKAFAQYKNYFVNREKLYPAHGYTCNDLSTNNNNSMGKNKQNKNSITLHVLAAETTVLM